MIQTELEYFRGALKKQVSFTESKVNKLEEVNRRLRETISVLVREKTELSKTLGYYKELSQKINLM